MGTVQSSKLVAAAAASPRRGGKADEKHNPEQRLVRMDRVIAKRGSNVPVSGRYTCTKTLEQEYQMLNKILGTGMSGYVCLAKSRADGRKCAVKSFKKSGLTLKNHQSMRNEVELYLHLDHPHIAQLNMVFETEDLVHLVMECMEGGELYDRLASLKRYSESAAADSLYQIILAVAYLHANNIAHRDLKLENFLYERKEASHVKLIDFGLAKFWDPSTRMSQACGSVHYVAPEVLSQSYTTQADMWSVGVIAYMLLTGSPCFQGTDSDVMRKIRAGKPHFSGRFSRLSDSAQSFVKQLLVVDPRTRLTAAQALEHPWISKRNSDSSPTIDDGIIGCLRTYADTSRFRRAALSMMAWSLTSDEQAELREQFLLMDVHKTGSIKLKDLKGILKENFEVDGTEAEHLFAMLDSDNSHEIEYSEFLAAALVGRVNAHEDLLRRTFARFDRDENGLVSPEELREVLGDSFEGTDIDELIKAVDTSGDGQIDYGEFLAYFQGLMPEASKRSVQKRNTEKLVGFIDKLLISAEGRSPRPFKRAEKRSRTSPLSLPTLLGSSGVRSMPARKVRT